MNNTIDNQPIPWQSLRKGDRVRITFEATVKYVSQYQANLHFEAHKEPESWSAFSKELFDTATITRIEEPVEKVVGYVSLGVRPDGVEHYRYQMSDGKVHEVHSHVSEHTPTTTSGCQKT